MIRRSLLLAVSGAMLLATSGGAWALPRSEGFDASSHVVARGTISLSDLMGGAKASETPMRVAQASDVLTRLQRLEEEVRRLNGRVEELSFQLLQAQEDMRRAQENNEFRFQELEQGPGSGGSGDGLPQQRGDLDLGSASGSDTAQAGSGADVGSGDDIAGILENPDFSAAGGADQTPVPSTAENGASEGVYREAYDQLLAGDYELAEQSFRQYVQTYPNAADIADAQYWLGESLFQQQRYADAAEVFLEGQKAHPNATKAPDMMLKLGMSLSALGNRDTACVTFREVASRYPDMSDNVRRKLSEEQSKAKC
ncbi:MAG: tol-pal system protein YbgF [Pseudomonadota bacterium]|nr:tol-pal system protein YbgF [Pseudomonadota bacterium]